MMNQQGPSGRLVAGGPSVMARQATRIPFAELALVVVIVGALAGGALPGPLMRTTMAQAVLQAHASVREEGKHRVLTEYARVPLSFVPNAGQTDMKVRFYAHGPGYRFYFTPEAAVLAFTKQADGKEKGLALYLRFLGGNPAPEIEGIQRTGGTVNYFVGRDPAKWQSGLLTYHAVVYRDLWPGIDMLFRSQDGRLKYEFHLAPGANPNDIRLAYAGAESLSVNAAGRLLIETPLGVLTDTRPVAYQQIGGRKVPVESRYALNRGAGANQSYGFALGTYDPRYPLVIDPGLAYSTYLGGTGSDTGVGLAVDKEGNAYIAGGTAAIDFPSMPGAFQPGAPGGFNAYVAKLNPSGSALVYATYLGGSGFDFALDLALDKDGHAYVVGFTDSSDFPTTPGAFQPTDPGPGASPQGDDGFVTKLSPSGSDLVYSTYLGGVGEDTANAIEVDRAGHAYVGSSGATSSFPTTPGAFMETDPGPTPPDQIILGQDVIISKLNPSGSGLVFATYLGGSARDGLNSMAVDEDGHVYAAGATDSTDFPTTARAFQTTDPQPVPPGPTTQPESGPDGFVTKLNQSGSALVYSTYLGGTGGAPGGTGEGIEGIGVDSAGNAYVTGRTDSAFDFPTTRGAWDTTYNGGPNDAFVAKLNRLGSRLIYSTYLGGSGDEEGGRFRVALDEKGSAYITSLTDSPDFPTTPNAFQTSLAGSFDVYVAVLNPAGSTLLFSTYLGGSGFELPNNIALGRGGHVYVTGRTRSSDFPTTPGSFQAVDPNVAPGGAGQDAFVTKIHLGH